MTLGYFFRECFGKGFAGKKIWEKFYSLPRLLIFSLLEGLITTDGTISSKGNIRLTMSNKKFLLDLYSLCRIKNISVGFPKVQKMYKNNTCPPYTMVLTSIKTELNHIWKIYDDDRVAKLKKEKSGFDQRCKIINNKTYLKCSSVKKVGPKEVSYSLNTREKTFTACGVILNNSFG